MMLLRDTLLRWKRERRLQILVRGGAAWSALVSAALGALFVADLLAALPQAARAAGLGVLGAMALAALWRLLLGPLWRLDEEEVFRSAAARWPELQFYVKSAWELSQGRHPEGLSLQLVKEHVAQTEGLLRKRPGRLYPATLERREWTCLATALAVSVVLVPLSLAHPSTWSRVLGPWQDVPLERLLAVRPGDAQVPWGEDVRIEAEWREALFQVPGLEVRSPDGRWRLQSWDEEAGRSFAFQVRELAEPLEYRLRWKDSLSRRYQITPVPYPHFTSVRLRVFSPDYVRRPPQEFEGGQDLEALPGSRIEVEGLPDRPVEEARLWVGGLSQPFRTGREGRLKASFLAESDALFHWELAGSGLRDPRPDQFQLRLLKDEPPTIELLSPAFEVEVSPREALPLTYEAEDDFGLASIELRYSREGREQVLPLETFARRPARFLGEARWDLTALQAGSVVDFYLRATDGHPSGQSGVSLKSRLRVVDFEGQHQSVQSEVVQAHRALERLRGREEALAEALARAQQQAPAPEELGGLMEGLQEEWRRTASEMESLAGAMEQDPYTNPGLVMEHRALAERLGRLSRDKVPPSLEHAREGKWAQAEAEHRALVRELQQAAEKMARSRQVQVVQDFWSEAAATADQGQELAQALEGLASDPQGATAEDRKRLEKALANIQEQMRELAKAIESLPKPSPGSQEAESRRTYSVPLGSALSVADELQKALAAGDIKRAAELARRLSEELGKVRQALAEAQQGIAQDMFGGGSEEMEELKRMWAEAVDAQSGVVAAGQALEEDRLKAKLEAQRSMLRSLAERQARLRDQAIARGMSQLLPAMEAARAEFESGRVLASEPGLRSAASLLSSLAASQPQDAALAQMAQEQQAILQSLAAGGGEPVLGEASAERSRGAGLAQRQNAERTRELSKRLEGEESLTAALEEMGPGAESFERADIPPALGHASKALELLEKGQSDFQKSLEERQKFKSGLSGPSGGGRPGVRPAGGVPSRSGARTGFVPLPGAQEYRPAQDVRREILKSLQERYPKTQEGVIRDYLKRLSE